MSNKTFGFVVKSADIQKAGKQAKTAPFLSAKQRTPFCLHPRPILGKIKNCTPIFVLCGSHSHEMALLFWMTILSTILVPVAKDTARRTITKKCGSPLRRSGVVQRTRNLRSRCALLVRFPLGGCDTLEALRHRSGWGRIQFPFQHSGLLQSCGFPQQSFP